MCHRSAGGGVNKVKEPIRGAGLRTEEAGSVTGHESLLGLGLFRT